MSDIQAGSRIRELREMKHFTRRDLADRVDISPKFLYEIEKGQKGFSAEILCRISQELSVSCDYIMLGEDKEHRGIEKILCTLENLEPKQISRVYDILTILCDMCVSL